MRGAHGTYAWWAATTSYQWAWSVDHANLFIVPRIGRFRRAYPDIDLHIVALERNLLPRTDPFDASSWATSRNRTLSPSRSSRKRSARCAHRTTSKAGTRPTGPPSRATSTTPPTVAIDPEPPGLGAPKTGREHRDRGVVTMDLLGSEDVTSDSFDDRPQQPGRLTDPSRTESSGRVPSLPGRRSRSGGRAGDGRSTSRPADEPTSPVSPGRVASAGSEPGPE